MNDQQLLRYSRHLLLPEIDIEGQQRLLDGSALIIGLGGLGSAVALYLAAAGVGRLTLVDYDQVELSNLQRQVIHTQARLGEAKAHSAAAAIAELNPQCAVEPLVERLDGAALAERAGRASVVLDCSDRFSSRQAINRACMSAGTPLVSGAAIRFSGQLAVFDPRSAQSPCYACLYGQEGDDEALSCAESGVVAPLVGVIGAWQALEAVKLISAAGTPAAGLSTFDGLKGEWRHFHLERDPACPVCATRPGVA